MPWRIDRAVVRAFVPLAVGCLLGPLLVGGVTIAAENSTLNQPPVALEDSATTPEDTSITIDVFDNDFDPDGDPLSIVTLGQPLHGFAQLAPAAGLVGYSPAPDYSGTDDFWYEISDGAGGTATAKVRVTITAVNDPPIAYNRLASTTEDTSVVAQLAAVDPDPEHCSLTFRILRQPLHGSLGDISDSGCSPNADFAAITYTPALNYNGSDQFVYVANDGTIDSNIATVSVTVSPANDPPVAYDRWHTTTASTPVGAQLVAFDVDTGSCALEFSIVQWPSHGNLGDITDGGCTPDGDLANVTYTPDPGYVGSDSFTYKASDGVAESNVATVNLSIVLPPLTHVGDLDAFSSGRGRRWNVSIWTLVHDENHVLVADATVTFAYSGTYLGTLTCTTDASGACTIDGPAKGKSVTFTVTGITHASRSYASAGNHDPDGDSNGTVIAVTRP